MSKKNINTVKTESLDKSGFTFLFGKRNYIWMGIGLALICLGFILMTGAEANTRPDGVYDVNYFNNDIYSWRRVRLAPLLIVLGIFVEIYAILINPTKKNN